MEIDQLTDEQIANLTPEQIEMLEKDPDRLAEILGKQTATDEPGQEEKHSALDVAANDAAPGAGKDEPVVLNKSGKGIIPYEKHKELRVENSALREQLQAAQLENSKAAEKLDALLKKKENASRITMSQRRIRRSEEHLELIKKNMPELHQAISAVLEGSRRQGEKLEKTLDELKREREEVSTAPASSALKSRSPKPRKITSILTHWESNDPEAWDEALKQDEILRTSRKWGGKPYAERFDEVVRRVRAIMPEASMPQKHADPEKTKADAKARLCERSGKETHNPVGYSRWSKSGLRARADRQSKPA